MNWGVVGLLLVSLALGIASAGCWRFGTTYAARFTPALLTFAYYAAQFIWPHAAFKAAAEHEPFPTGDQVRLMLLGIAFIVAVRELIARLASVLENNRKLREKLGYQREGET